MENDSSRMHVEVVMIVEIDNGGDKKDAHNRIHTQTHMFDGYSYKIDGSTQRQMFIHVIIVF